MYPTDLNGEVHHDGTIWSHALWNLRTAIGANHADTAILWAQFGWTGTTMPDLANRIVTQVTDPLRRRAGRGAPQRSRPRHPLGDFRRLVRAGRRVKLRYRGLRAAGAGAPHRRA